MARSFAGRFRPEQPDQSVVDVPNLRTGQWKYEDCGYHQSLDGIGIEVHFQAVRTDPPSSDTAQVGGGRAHHQAVGGRNAPHGPGFEDGCFVVLGERDQL